MADIVEMLLDLISIAYLVMGLMLAALLGTAIYAGIAWLVVNVVR